MAATEPTDKASLDEAFSQLYRAHLRDVYSYSYYRVGNHHDAEDLTEQTFLQAYRHFERAQRESEGRPLRPWLIRIAHNLAANYYRDRSRRPQTPIDDAGPLSAPLTLKRALSPVDPPRELEARLELTLGSLVDMAAEELEAWELSTFRDPRNWSRIARPVAAAAIGSGAAVGLVLIRTQRKRHRRRHEAASPVDLVGRTVRDLAREARRVADDVF